MITENDFCLYVFVRTVLDSMNSGKAQAHSGHASNAFVFKYFIDAASLDHKEDVKTWMMSTPQGFGTQINLRADNWEQMCTELTSFALENDYAFGNVIDPTYPFEVTPEVYALMRDDYTDGAIPKKGKYLCFREEETAFYIFGQRSDRKLSNALKGYKLHP